LSANMKCDACVRQDEKTVFGRKPQGVYVYKQYQEQGGGSSAARFSLCNIKIICLLTYGKCLLLYL